MYANTHSCYSSLRVPCVPGIVLVPRETAGSRASTASPQRAQSGWTGNSTYGMNWEPATQNQPGMLHLSLNSQESFLNYPMTKRQMNVLWTQRVTSLTFLISLRHVLEYDKNKNPSILNVKFVCHTFILFFILFLF